MENAGSQAIICECGQAYIYRNGRCKKCYILDTWRTSTSTSDLGIVLFFRAVLPEAFKNFKYGFPNFHREILWEALQDQPDWKFIHRKVAVAAPRGSAKTTLLSKGLALYCAVFGLKRYIVISSKTARAAQKNLRWIRQRLGSSRVIQWFGDLRPDSRGKRLEVDEIEGVWTKEIVVLRNGVTIESVGMGQQLRSSTEGEDVNRIDLFIADDCESDENTQTPERREDNEEWLYDVVLPSLDFDEGSIVFINTMTHTLSILAKITKPGSGWRAKFYELTCRNGNGEEVSLWPEKFPLKDIDALREDYKKNGRLRSFYKEYYNRVESEEGIPEHWIRYWEGEVFTSGSSVWIRFKTNYDPEWKVRPCYLTMGIDLAFSRRERADFSVILLLAQVPDGRKFVVDYRRGKFSLYDDYAPDGKLLRSGISNQAVALHLKSPCDCICIDATGTQLGTFNQLKSDLQNSGRPVRVIPYQAVGEKFQRLKDRLQPEYEIGNVHHLEWMDDLRTELVSMGDTTDDVLDALFNAVEVSKAPPDREYNSLYSKYEDVKSLEDNSYLEQLRKVARVTA